ncbi:MAG: O-antigen ligase family protein [Planctomycetota bacterium]
MELVLIIAIGILLGFIVFIHPTIGLTIILFCTLFFPEIEVGAVTTLTGLKPRGISLRPEDFLMILAGLGWFANAAIRRKFPTILHNPLNVPILALMLVMILTTIIGISQGTTTAGAGFFFALKRIQYFIVFFLVIGNIRTLSDVRKSVLSFFIFSTIVAAWSIIEYLTLEAGRITGPFMRSGQPPILGGFFLTVIFLALGFFLKYKNWQQRLPLFAILVLSFAVIIFTKTRSSYVGAFIGLIIFGIILRKPFLIVLPFLLFITMYYLFPMTIVEQMTSVRGVWQRGQERSFAPSWDARIQSWKDAAPEIAKYPIFGQGAGSYSLAWIDNQYMIDLLYMGIVGLGVFIWLLIRIFRSVYPFAKSRQANDKQKDDGAASDYNFISALTAGYLGGLIALLVHAFAVTTFYNIRTMIPFWLLTGLVIAGQHLSTEDKESQQPIPGHL